MFKKLEIAVSRLGDVSIRFYVKEDDRWVEKAIDFSTLHNMFLQAKIEHRRRDVNFRSKVVIAITERP